jgi:TnpA family transposase
VTYDQRRARTLALVACLVHTARMRARDDLAEMLCKRMASIVKKARTELEEIRLRQRETSEQLIGTYRTVLEHLDPDGETASQAPGQGAARAVAAVEEAGGFAAQLAGIEEVSAFHGDNYEVLVHRFFRKDRAVMFELASKLELVATSSDAPVLAALEHARAYHAMRRDFIPLPPAADDGDPEPGLGFASGNSAGGHRPPPPRHGDPAALRGDGVQLPGRGAAHRGYRGSRRRGVRRLAQQPAALVRVRAAAGEVLREGRPAGHRGRVHRAAAARAPGRGRRAGRRMGWHHHFGPASGSDPKISDPLGRYCMAVFAGGANIGPYEAARHIAGVSARELSMVRNRHIDLNKLNAAIATVVNAFAELDVVKAWGDGTAVAADGTQVETYIDNLLAETSIRYGGVGGIAYHYVSDTYVALFSRFIPVGVWEAVHLIEGLLANTSDIQPTAVHADTQGQSFPVFTLATLFGFDLMPRIRNFKDLIFFRASEHLIYPHIDELFGERGRNVIDWPLIERHWQDLMQVAISISAGRLSSATLMRRLRSNSRKNRIYKVFREVGRSVRTVALLRYLADPRLRARITAATNKVESYHGFAQWLSFGNNGVLADNDPAEQEKLIKLNTLLANCVIFHNALDIMDVVRGLVAEGWLVTADQLGTLSPYLRAHISRYLDMLQTCYVAPAWATIRIWPLAGHELSTAAITESRGLPSYGAGGLLPAEYALPSEPGFRLAQRCIIARSVRCCRGRA